MNHITNSDEFSLQVVRDKNPWILLYDCSNSESLPYYPHQAIRFFIVPYTSKRSNTFGKIYNSNSLSIPIWSFNELKRLNDNLSKAKFSEKEFDERYYYAVCIPRNLFAGNLEAHIQKLNELIADLDTALFKPIEARDCTGAASCLYGTVTYK